ncbi:MAG: hypothetical protein AAGG08_03180 [Actinomycetota bacterium]
MRHRTMHLRYGPSRHQRIGLRPPHDRHRQRHATAIVLHGGFWRWPYGRLLMRRAIGDLRGRGWWVADIEYRRLGRLGGGGGFPATFDDAEVAVRHVHATTGGPLVLIGHSAGGHLALCAAHAVAGSVPLAGVVAIAAPTDLEALVQAGHPHARAITGIDTERDVGSRPTPSGPTAGGPPRASRLGAARAAVTSPIRMAPFGVPIHAVHSEIDDVVDVGQSRRFIAAAANAGDAATLTIVPDESHRAALRPSSTTWRRARRAAEDFVTDRAASSLQVVATAPDEDIVGTDVPRSTR